MKEDIYMRRLRWPFLIFSIGAGIVFLAWTLHEAGFIAIEGASSWWFRVFAVGFLLPIIVYFCILLPQRDDCVLSIREAQVELSAGWMVKRRLRLPLGHIRNIRTNWKGPNSDSASDLIFLLDTEGSDLARTSKVLRHHKGEWLFEFSNIEFTPFEAVELIHARIQPAGC